MKRILITGSRKFQNAKAMREALLENGPGKVIEGDATGADRLSRAIVWGLGWGPTETHYALWDVFGKAAGHIRNQEMVDSGADICLAFPLRGSSGTWDCAARSLRAGIEVSIILTDDLTEEEMDTYLERAKSRLERRWEN